MYRVRFQPTFPPWRYPWSTTEDSNSNDSNITPTPPPPTSTPRSGSSLSNSSIPPPNLSTTEPSPPSTCSICTLALHTPDSSGTIETPLSLPCGHTFGSLCITRWLENESRHKTCPICRRSMRYKSCGHLIRPSLQTNALGKVKEEEMPERCVVCRGGEMVEGRLKGLRERREMQERALRGLESLPRVYGEVCWLMVGGIEGRVGLVREAWWKEVDDLRVELERDRAEW